MPFFSLFVNSLNTQSVQWKPMIPSFALARGARPPGHSIPQTAPLPKPEVPLGGRDGDERASKGKLTEDESRRFEPPRVGAEDKPWLAMTWRRHA